MNRWCRSVVVSFYLVWLLYGNSVSSCTCYDFYSILSYQLCSHSRDMLTATVSHWRGPSLLILNTSCQVRMTSRASSDNDIPYSFLSLLLLSSLPTSLGLSCPSSCSLLSPPPLAFLLSQPSPAPVFDHLYWSVLQVFNSQAGNGPIHSSLFTIPPISLSLPLTHTSPSGSQDGTVHVWLADTGEKVAVLDGGHPGPTHCAQFNPKFMMMASACSSMVCVHCVCIESCDGHVIVM